MKVIRAPLRVSLFGGGTDLEPFCTEHGSTIISFAINRYMYLTWNDRPTGGCRLSYSQVEELRTLRDAQHTLVAQTAQALGIEEPCTLTIVSDLPAGTGLGSSSALAVTLAKLARPEWSDNPLVRQAGMLEHALSKAGWQDYLPAAYGGFNVYRFGGAEDAIAVTPVSDAIRDIVNRYGLLLYTGASRPADSVLPSWQKSTKQLSEIRLLADAIAECIDDMDVEQLARYLDLTWNLKKSISGVSGGAFDEQYDLACDYGALAGKLCGAGAGGCWFFLVPPEQRRRVVEVLDMREIPFQVARKGVETWEP